MTLEKRVAYWVDLGVTHYADTYNLQRRVAEARKQDLIPDVILATQHYPLVSFGSDQPNNQFSDSFLQAVQERYGSQERDSIMTALADRGINFMQSSRGGGATVLAPGQLVYYPVTKHEEVTGKILDMGVYKAKVYSIMFETLEKLGVEGIKVGTQDGYETRRNRRDVWKERDGVSLKMGSKGLKFSGPVAYHGFVLYVDKKGLDDFTLVKPCGYDPSEVRATSVEEELGRIVPHGAVHEEVQRNFAKHFGYEGLVTMSQTELEERIGAIDVECPT